MIGGAGFVNHKWDEKDPSWEHIISGLYKRELAGIHYGVAPVSFKKSDWDNNTDGNRIDRLNDHVEEDRVVSLNYTHPKLSGGCYIGRPVEEGQEPMRLIVCDSTRDNPDEAIVDTISLPTRTGEDEIEPSEFDSSRAEEVVQKAICHFDQDQKKHVELEDYNGKYYILKGFRMDQDAVEWVWNDDFPGIWAMQQRGTVTRKDKGEIHWYIAYYAAVSTNHELQSVGDIFNIVRENINKDITDVMNNLDKSREDNFIASLDDEVPERFAVYTLSADQLEALCEEYLRKVRFPKDFDELITTGGSQGSLSDADIIGVSSGKKVLAQVSFETNDIRDKMNRLANYSNGQTDREVFYFGPSIIKDSGRLNGIEGSGRIDEYIPIENLLDEVDDEYKNRLLQIELSDRSRPYV